VSWFQRLRRFSRAGSAALGAVLLLASLIAGAHRHTGGPEASCAVCTLAHSPADAAPKLALPAAPLIVVDREYVAPAIRPASAARIVSSSRAPPTA